MSFTLNICLLTIGAAYIFTGNVVKSAPQMSMGNYSLPDMSMGGIDMGGIGMGGNGVQGGSGGGYQPWSEFQNQTGGMMPPGMQIGSGYVDQLQGVTMPPLSAGDLTNATVPSGGAYWNQLQQQGSNLNNQTSQFQGCMPIGNNGQQPANP